MAENHGYGYSSYHHDCQSDHDDTVDHYVDSYDDDEDDAAAESLDAVDYTDHDADHGAKDDADVSAEKFAGDARFLTEEVHEVLDDPAVDESAADERILRMKNSRRGQLWARRKREWQPPDLRRYGPPVFWPADEPHVPGPARRPAIDPFDVRYDVLRQVIMTTLVSCPEIARAKGRDEVQVMQAAQYLQKRGRLRIVSFGCRLPRTTRYWLAPDHFDGGSWSDLAPAVMSWHSNDGI